MESEIKNTTVSSTNSDEDKNVTPSSLPEVTNGAEEKSSSNTETVEEIGPSDGGNVEEDDMKSTDKSSEGADAENLKSESEDSIVKDSQGEDAISSKATVKDKVEPGTSTSSDGAVSKEEKQVSEKESRISPEPEESEDEGIDLGNPEEMTGNIRNKLYYRGLKHLNKENSEEALTSFLKSLTGLKNASGFTCLPQCLRKIADIYYAKEEYEKAIQFIQAEKIFYESALVDTTELQKELEEKKAAGDTSGDPNTEKPEVLRADEYENLARICLESGQAQLALEYQGKATKIRQQILGNDHEVTAKSLDLFTVIYGEVGKQQYTESIEKLNKEKEEVRNEARDQVEDIETFGMNSESPHSILRKRKKQKSEEEKVRDKRRRSSQQVRFIEPLDIREQEEWISNAVILLLFFVVLAFLISLMLYIYCRMDYDSRTCATWKSELQYYYMRFKYFVYSYISSDKVVG